MRWMDEHPAVIKWGSENVVIPYFSSSENKMRRYYMDFFCFYKTAEGKARKILIEVKPYSQTIQPTKRGRKKLETYLNELKTYQVNKDKWAAAEKYAKGMGWGFVIMTEYELYPEKYAKGRPQPKQKKRT